MTELENDILAKNLIDKYWVDFRSGTTWNFYSCGLRRRIGDTWAKTSEWIENAKVCIESNINLIQALEILLVEEKEQYLEVAEHVVSDWYKSGAHDPYYYYQVMAKLPDDNFYRKKYLSPENYESFIGNDGWGYSDSARKALIEADDESFQEFIGDFINERFKSSKLPFYELEDFILPLFIDLGKKTERYVAKNNNERFKEFCLGYLEKDESLIEKFLNSDIDEDERQIWIGDNIAYYSWALGWDDIINDLKTKDWYWMGLFSDWWDDSENKNLLVWGGGAATM